MKGVILAGGLGSRLRPLTLVTNKHLLPVYDRPMIYYPIQCLLNAGINEILVVTGGEHAGDFLKLLGNGKSLGVKDLHYTYQEGEGGIADELDEMTAASPDRLARALLKDPEKTQGRGLVFGGEAGVADQVREPDGGQSALIGRRGFRHGAVGKAGRPTPGPSIERLR